MMSAWTAGIAAIDVVFSFLYLDWSDNGGVVDFEQRMAESVNGASFNEHMIERDVLDEFGWCSFTQPAVEEHLVGNGAV